MKIFATVLAIAVLAGGSALATIYKYVDDNGQVNYTNVLSSVPRGKQAHVVKFKEYKSNVVPKRAFPVMRRTLTLPDPADSARELLIEKKHEQRKKLQAEYDMLLKEKEALDHNKSFQKRREKRKYRHRPYIKKLIQKETQITMRMEELSAELKATEKQ